MKKKGPHIDYPLVAADENSIYSIDWLGVIHDEAHLARNIKSAMFHPLRALSKRATMAIAATATPIVTLVSDAVSLGLLVNHPSVSTPELYTANIVPALKALNRAKASATRARTAAAKGDVSGGKAMLMRALDTSEILPREPEVMIVVKQADAIGNLFRDNIIRRTPAMVGADRKLPPLTTVTLYLTPHAHELVSMRKAIDDLYSKGKPSASITEVRIMSSL